MRGPSRSGRFTDEPAWRVPIRYDRAMPPQDRTSRGDRARQAKAWSIALDPIYGMIGLGAIGYAIDSLVVGTGLLWTILLAIAGLITGFYRFIREAMDLSKEQAKASPKTDGDPET